MDRNHKLQEAIEHAEASFWMAVTEIYPEVKTGDINPLTDQEFKVAMRKAILEWLRLNVPTPAVTRAVIDLIVEMRPPKKGERGWMVEATNADAALAEVLRESEELGWISPIDQHDGLDENGMRAVTIILGSPKPAEILQPLQLREMMASQGFTEPPITRSRPLTPCDLKMRELEDALNARPMYNGWIFDVMGHTGALCYVHPESQVTVYCTPDWETKGYLAISCESDNGKPLSSDYCGPVHDEGLEFDVMTDTADKLFALVKPWLDKHQPAPSTTCPQCGQPTK